MKGKHHIKMMIINLLL